MINMKSSLLSVFITVMFLAGVLTVAAQSSGTLKPQANDPSGWHISLLSAGIGTGFYTPSFSFWNNESEIRNWDQKFGSSILSMVNVQVGLRDNLSIRGEAGFATLIAGQSAIPLELGGGKQWKQVNLVPISALLLYEITKKYKLIPYVGAGAGSIMISSTHEKMVGTQTPTRVKSSATDYMFYGVGGVKYWASPKLFLAAELRGAMGKYIENVTNTQLVPELQDISLNGLQAQLSLNYSFGKK